MTDVENKKYLDLTAGIGVTNLGHCHPKITAAVVEQAGKLVHGQGTLCAVVQLQVTNYNHAIFLSSSKYWPPRQLPSLGRTSGQDHTERAGYFFFLLYG